MKKIEKRKRGFFAKLVDSGNQDAVSHKRIVALTSLIMLVGLAIASAVGYSSDIQYAYIFASLTGTESILTVLEKINTTTKNLTHVASDISDKFMHGDHGGNDEF